MEVEDQVSSIGHNQSILPILQAFRFVLRQLFEEPRQVNDDTVT